MNTVKTLLQKAQEGDMDAFADLFEPWRGRIHAVAWRMTGANNADDVVMETFLRAWQGLPAFNGRSALSTWLYRIARNCALDSLRRSTVRRAESLDASDEAGGYERQPDTSALSPSEQAEQKDEQSVVRAALAQLPDTQRQTLELRYTDDLSYADIAATTGVSIGTVMSRLFNGRAKMRRLLLACKANATEERTLSP